MSDAIDPNVSQAEVRGRYDYSPETGIFTDKSSGKPVGYPNSSGYMHARLGGRTVGLHRIAFMWMLGYWPTKQVDHINGDRSDNRWGNLRPATAAQNSQNRRPSGANFGMKGITQKADGTWVAQAQINGKRQAIPGVFESAYAAHQAYAAVVKRMSGQYARLDGSIPKNKPAATLKDVEQQMDDLLQRRDDVERQLKDINDFIRALEPELAKAQKDPTGKARASAFRRELSRDEARERQARLDAEKIEAMIRSGVLKSVVVQKHHS